MANPGNPDKAAQALKFAENGRFEDACSLYEEMLTEHPDDAGTLYNLGMCFTELHQPEKAVRALEQAVRHKPDHTNAYVALGVAYSKIEDFEKAKECFSTALKIDPKNSYALRNLGGLHGKTGDDATAVSELEQAYAINPSDPRTVYGLGHTYEQLKDNDKADRYYKEVLNLDAPTEIKGLAREGLRRISLATFKSKGPRMDAVFYMVSALKLFKDKSDAEMKRIAFEIAMKGRSGFEVNDPDKRYTLSSLQGEFSGLQMVCYMYVGFKRIGPSQDIGFDLSQEYATALQMFGSGESA